MKYRKQLINLIIVLSMSMVGLPCFAQSSQERMQQDVEVMGMIVKELFSRSHRLGKVDIDQKFVINKGIYFEILLPGYYVQAGYVNSKTVFSESGQYRHCYQG